MRHPGRLARLRRSIVVGDELWTISAAGALVSREGDLAPLAWIRFA